MRSFPGPSHASVLLRYLGRGAGLERCDAAGSAHKVTAFVFMKDPI